MTQVERAGASFAPANTEMYLVYLVVARTEGGATVVGVADDMDAVKRLIAFHADEQFKAVNITYCQAPLRGLAEETLTTRDLDMDGWYEVTAKVLHGMNLLHAIRFYREYRASAVHTGKSDQAKARRSVQEGEVNALDAVERYLLDGSFDGKGDKWARRAPVRQ